MIPLPGKSAQSGKTAARKWLIVLAPAVVSLLVGVAAAYLQADSVRDWYPYLNKPPLMPPDIVFPVVWTLLYVMMGISIGLIRLTDSPRKTLLTRLFAIQLFLNFSWCVLFFRLQNPLAGLACILLLDAAVAVYTVKAWSVRKDSALLFAPYLAWIYFATYLNGYIFLHN